MRDLSAEEVRERVDSPVFRGGVLVPDFATVHPARLALGLRGRLLERGVEIFENSRVRSCPHRCRFGHGAVRDSGARSRRRRRARGGPFRPLLRPLRSRLSVTSSHIVLTEPVPDVIEQIGWTGGECITDGRTLLHYFRTTRDGRIAFGWGGGRLAYGSRVNGRIEVDGEVAATVHRHLLRIFPALEGRRITHAWGGPIDVSPSHIPQIDTLPSGPVHFALGFTGNGVGPTHLAGERWRHSRSTGATAGRASRWSARRRAAGCLPSRSPGWAGTWSGERSCGARTPTSAASGPARSPARCARCRGRSESTWRAEV